MLSKYILIFKQKVPVLTIGVQHTGDVKVLLSDVKGGVEVLQWVVLRQFAVVDQVRPVSVDEGTEGQTILEGQVEVLDVHILVGRCLTLAPEKQTFL